MATTSGTASNFTDLLTRFNTFVTTGLGAQNWTKLKDGAEGIYDRALYYQAPGLAGANQIFMNVASFKDVGEDYYNFGLRAATGFNGGATWDNQPNQSPASYLLLWNTSIPYWFIANGRCAKILAKVSGVWQCGYIGFITPAFSPSEWALPLFVGGMHSEFNKRFSNTEPLHRAYWNPASDQPPSIVPGENSGAFLRSPGGEWIAFGNYSRTVESGFNVISNHCWPYCTQYEQVATLYGAPTEYGLQPIVLHGASQGKNNWGEFDGIYFISGFANAAQNIIAIAGTNYLVVPSAFRTSGPSAGTVASNQYAAFRLS